MSSVSLSQSSLLVTQPCATAATGYKKIATCSSSASTTTTVTFAGGTVCIHIGSSAYGWQRSRLPLARNLRRYLRFLSGTLVLGTSIILKHPFTAPPIASWPLHLALFVAVIRTTYDYQEHIVGDLPTIRALIDTFFYCLPKLPQMHILPFQIPISKHGRGFPGLLEAADKAETGKRTISGQWISDWKVWSQVAEKPLASTALSSPIPSIAARAGEKVIFYVHGGGYVLCSTYTHRELLWRISRATGRRLFAVDYRLAPEHPFPAALQDVAHAFSYLTSPDGCGFDPRNVTIAGDSAGGGLSIALMMFHRDHCMTSAADSILLSPWLDLTMSCDSWESNSKDYLPRPPRLEDKFNPISFYCSGRDRARTLARHPYISPLYGDLERLPPTLIQCGEAERLRDECLLYTYKARGRLSAVSANKLPFQASATVLATAFKDDNTHKESLQEPRVANTNKTTSKNPVREMIEMRRDKSRKQGGAACSVELEMFPEMVHVFQAIPFLPESSMALERMKEFLVRRELEMEESGQSPFSSRRGEEEEEEEDGEEEEEKSGSDTTVVENEEAKVV